MICCVLCLCYCCTANAQIAKIYTYIHGVLLLLYICCCCIDEYWKFILIGIITRTRWDANAISGSTVAISVLALLVCVLRCTVFMRFKSTAVAYYDDFTDRVIPSRRAHTKS